MNQPLFSRLSIALAASFLAACAATSPSEETETKPEKKKGDVKPYDEVITSDAVTSTGLFGVHEVDGEFFFEIPVDQLGVDMLWVTQISKTQAGSSYAGMPAGSRTVRWELRNETVLLRDVKYTIRSRQDDAIRYAVDATSLSPILYATPVKAWGEDDAPVINVTSLFTSDVPEFSVKSQMNASGADDKRSFVDQIKTFPSNIETKVLLTYKLEKDAENKQDRKQSALTVQLHHSMVRLPDDLMRPRREDDRVGFFSGSFEDYGDPDSQTVERVSYIHRWRLEKKDPTAELSEPKKPIVFYVGREVPAKWRDWVHKGIEAWQPAFETAGFENAIVAKDAPSHEEDPDWDAEDARYATIRWLPSTVENAFGPHIADPRTGEILEADIRMFHNVLKLARDWYFAQAGANDPRAQSLPLPDELLGELLAYVVSHEVGHSLGFPHNMKASSCYTAENLRDPEFTAKHGTEASIMDYGRFNYVAQPGDGARLIPIIGPYDRFAVEWGYREFPEAGDWTAEKAKLDEIVARQVNDRMLLFGSRNPSEDPTQQTEDLGADAIQSTSLGLMNIDRIAGFLVSATCKENEDYELLENMHDALLAQRSRELGHVANVVGGFVEKNLFFGDAESRFAPVSADKQRAAVAFLNQHAFQTPSSLVAPAITLRLKVSGVADAILGSQKRVLRTLISEKRIDRMAEQTTWDTGDVYLGTEMMSDLTSGIWSELDSAASIDLYRRNLQRAHVELLSGQIEEEHPESDLPALCRGELESILDAIEALDTTGIDRTTALHLDDIRNRIGQLLDPRAMGMGRAAEAGAQRTAK